MTNPARAAQNYLDLITTQALAVATLGDLLSAVDIESEQLPPETLNNVGTLMNVISTAILDSAYRAKKVTEQATSQ